MILNFKEMALPLDLTAQHHIIRYNNTKVQLSYNIFRINRTTIMWTSTRLARLQKQRKNKSVSNTWVPTIGISILILANTSSSGFQEIFHWLSARPGQMIYSTQSSDSSHSRNSTPSMGEHISLATTCSLFLSYSPSRCHWITEPRGLSPWLLFTIWPWLYWLGSYERPFLNPLPMSVSTTSCHSSSRCSQFTVQKKPLTSFFIFLLKCFSKPCLVLVFWDSVNNNYPFTLSIILWQTSI